MRAPKTVGGQIRASLRPSSKAAKVLLDMDGTRTYLEIAERTQNTPESARALACYTQRRWGVVLALRKGAPYVVDWGTTGIGGKP